MIEQLLTYLPLIFSYWSGILIAWGLFSLYGLIKITAHLKEARHATRESDTISLILVLLGTTLLLISMFIVPTITSMIMDVMLGVNLWYTLFLLYVTLANLKLWPFIPKKYT